MSAQQRHSSGSSSHQAHPPSPDSSSFRSANVTLPETTSFYQQSIEASRTSLNERRFHAVNSLHGHGERSVSRQSQSSPAPVDEEIAQGLGEEVNGGGTGTAQGGDGNDGDASSVYSGFLPSRSKSQNHTILPSSAFFVPKRPPQNRSPRTPLSGLPSPQVSGPNNGPLSHSSDNFACEPVFQRGDPTPLDHNGRETRMSTNGGEGSIGAGSSFALGGSSSDGHGGPLMSAHQGSSKVDRSAIQAYRHGVPGSKASRDPLLNRGDTGEQDSIRARDSSYWNQSATKRSLPQRNQVQPSPSAEGGTTKQKSGVRGYKSHRGSNRFFLWGLIMTSDDNPLPFLASLVIIVALPALWFVFVAPYTWHHISPAPVIVFAYLWAVAASSMCVTAWRDPGVIPRDLDPDPPCTAGEEGKALGVEDPLAVPMPRIVRVRNGTDLKVKWCDTCGTYRPPRSSHCRVCDNCVENIDHHCTFLNTCIGRRNYFSFFAFLIASILACLLATALSILHIYYLTRPLDYALPGGGFGGGKSLRQSLQATPLSAVIFLLCLSLVIPLFTLFGYHLRLVCMNRTTVEQIRINTTKTYGEKPSYDDDGSPSSPPDRSTCFSLGIPGRDPNPFAHRTVFRNVREALLRPMMADSWINRYRFPQPDQRRINPAFA